MKPLTNRLLGIYPAIYKCDNCSSLIEVSKEDIKIKNEEETKHKTIPGSILYRTTQITFKELRYYEYFNCPKCNKNPITFTKINYEYPMGIRPPKILYGQICNIYGENVVNEYLILYKNE